MSPAPGQTLPNSASNAGSDLKVVCPKCGELRGSRVKRRGFFQKQIMPFFGYFPWQCGACRHEWNSKLRGEKKRRRSRSEKAYVEPHLDFQEAPHLTGHPAVPAPPAQPSTAHPIDNHYEDDSHEDVE